MNIRQVTATLIAISLLAAGCSGSAQHAASPAPTQAAPAASAAPANTTAPAVPTSTAAPAAPTATSSPVAASPTAVPAKAASATPTTGQTGGNASAVQAGVSLPKLPADATDCGSDMGCFVQASLSAHPAKVDLVTPPANSNGMLMTATDSLGIGGKEGDKVLFYVVLSKVEGKLSDEAIQAARKAGKTDADIQKSQDDANASARQMLGTGVQCKYSQPDLTSMLQKLQKGDYSEQPGAKGECTPITPSAAATNGVSAAPAAAAQSTGNAAQLRVPLPTLSADAADCGSGTDLGCMVQAAQSGHDAKFMFVIPPLDLFGVVASTTQFLAIEGKQGDKLHFYEVVTKSDAKLDDSVVQQARQQGKSDAEIQASADQAEANAQKQVGTGKDCTFSQADLTAVLQAWGQGKFSSSDWDKGQCTDVAPSGSGQPGGVTQSGSSISVTASGTQSLGQATATTTAPAIASPQNPAAVPTQTPGGPKLADPSVLPAELKSLPVPQGFGVVDGSPVREANGGVLIYAEAQWFGNMSVKDVAAFYTQALAADWSTDSEDVEQHSVGNNYINKKDNTLALYLEVEETDSGTTIDLKVQKIS